MRSKSGEILAAILLAAVAATVFFTPYAAAETIHVYVQKMPPQWQNEFDSVLPDAMQYWQNKIPKLTFEVVRFVGDSDVVVEWASQHKDGRLGYYSTNTANEYGKPVMLVTVGHTQDKKWGLAPPDFVLDVAKHELGHVVGLPYSDNPNDIMYPTVEDYESWQQMIGRDTRTADGPSASWQEKSEKHQDLADKMILRAESRLDVVHDKLILATLETTPLDKQDEAAWLAYWWAKKYLHGAEKMHSNGEEFALEDDYQNSYIEFKSAYDYAKKAEVKIDQILKFVDSGKGS